METKIISTYQRLKYSIFLSKITALHYKLLNLHLHIRWVPIFIHINNLFIRTLEQPKHSDRKIRNKFTLANLAFVIKNRSHTRTLLVYLFRVFLLILEVFFSSASWNLSETVTLSTNWNNISDQVSNNKKISEDNSASVILRGFENVTWILIDAPESCPLLIRIENSFKVI